MRIATLAIIVKDGRVNLGYKKKDVEEISDIINGPGGKQEPGESLVECVIRETFDEMGIRLFAERLEKIAVITFYAGDEPDFEVHLYWTDDFEGTPTETESMIPCSYPADELPLDKMLRGDAVWFAKAVNREKFNAKVYYKTRAKDFLGIKWLPFTP